MKFIKEKEFLLRIENISNTVSTREIVSAEKLETLRKTFPQISNDYLDYLSEIGSGNIRSSLFKVQPYLFDFSDIGLEEVYSVKNDVKFFGDNFNGDFSGFDFSKNTNEVVEFWHESGTIHYTNKTFREYIFEIIKS